MSEQVQAQLGQVEAQEVAQAKAHDFKIYTEVPLNAEPHKHNLIRSSVTPLDQFYHRNHALLRPAAEGESLDEWTLTVAVESELANALDWKKWRQGTSSLALSGKDIKQKYRKRRFAAAIECAGNRRIEFNEERKTEGIEWDGGVIASLIWGGASLRGLLLDLGIPDPFEEAARAGKLDLLPPSEDSVRQDGAAWAQDVHVHFISTEETQETDAGERYAASISIATAMHPNHGCLLAYEHNGQPLTPAHGFPLRAVLPGIIGARWTKYLGKILISREANKSPAMRADYKDFKPPSDDPEEVARWIDTMSTEGKHTDMKKRQEELEKLPPLQRLGISSAIAEPAEGEVVKPKKPVLRAKGYAVGHEGFPVSDVQVLLLHDLRPDTKASEFRVEASKAEDVQWVSANLQSALPEDGETASEYSFGWTLWHVDLPLSKEEHASGKWALVARAATAKQRQEQESAWNLRGFAQRGWPVVRGISFDLS